MKFPLSETELGVVYTIGRTFWFKPLFQLTGREGYAKNRPITFAEFKAEYEGKLPKYA